MGRTTHRPDAPLTEADRLRIAEAREILASYREPVQEVEPLSELGYEQRMARTRALELMVQAVPASQMPLTYADLLKAADHFYKFIWEGDTSAGMGG